MLLETNSFEFGEFLLDTDEKVLLRRGEPVSITPKIYDLLYLLVKNHGHIVEKNLIMNEVWTDRFVEESNLTYSIHQLRTILDDDAKNPEFIETVPKRGYRFIAEVKEVSAKPEIELQKPKTDFVSPEKTSLNQKFKTRYVLTAVFLICSIVFGGWYLQSSRKAQEIPILTAPFASEKLTTNGQVSQAVISPDGKNVIYVNGFNSDKQSVWLRQLESDNNVEIIAPSEDIYFGLAISPDGNFLYFVRRPKSEEAKTAIYRVSVFGGVPTKIIEETQGWISISPDGAKISFVRCNDREDENCSLWIADSLDGKNEKKLASRPRPFRIADNKISPDGKTVAFAAGQSENQANEFGLMEVDIESGKETELTEEKFFNIKSLAWLPDKNGLLITASRIPNKKFRIWQVSLDSGKAVPLTKDSESYSVLSLDKTAGNLVSTQIKQDFHLYLYKMENPSVKRVLADAATADFTPDGKIIFSSPMSGNDEIWSINTDGSGQKQLTNNASDESRPIVSPDGKTIFFASNRTGEAQVWRMNADGSNQTQVTNKEGGFPITVSPDGEWVYYHHGRDRTLWRVAAKGGAEQSVLNKGKYLFAVSPGGLQVVFSEKQGEERNLTIVSMPDGRTIKTFNLRDKKALILKIAWLSDEKSIAYTTTDDKFENNILWLQPMSGGSPEKIADLGNEEVNSLTLSSDGKEFAVAQGVWKHDAVLLKGLK